MKLAGDILLYVVAVLHLWFMVLESFLWTRPLGLKTFRNTPQSAEATKVLAFNQGFYNGFLAVGLIWGQCTGNVVMANFFLGCVVVAGIVGALSVSKKIFVVQALPAVAALILRCISLA